MITITLPPELEQIVNLHAKQHGTTTELYLLDDLRARYLPEMPAASDGQDGETMADFFDGYAGTINSRDIIPKGVHLSKDTGRKFKELLSKKHQDEKL